MKRKFTPAQEKKLAQLAQKGVSYDELVKTALELWGIKTCAATIVHVVRRLGVSPREPGRKPTLDIKKVQELIRKALAKTSTGDLLAMTRSWGSSVSVPTLHKYFASNGLFYDRRDNAWKKKKPVKK